MKLASIMSNCVSGDWRRKGWCQAMLYRGLRIGFFHIADESLPTIVHMDVLDANKLVPAVAQPPKHFHLGRISFARSSIAPTARPSALP
jgi:hypothetical protein